MHNLWIWLCQPSTGPSGQAYIMPQLEKPQAEQRRLPQLMCTYHLLPRSGTSLHLSSSLDGLQIGYS